MVPPCHDEAVGDEHDANDMKDIEGTNNGWVGLQEFPEESLERIPAHEQIESVAQHEFRAGLQRVQIEGEKRKHRRRLIELDGMAWDAVAEIDAPRQCGWRAIGVIGKAREKTSEA